MTEICNSEERNNKAEYTVEIPIDKQRQFESFVKDIGGIIVVNDPITKENEEPIPSEIVKRIRSWLNKNGVSVHVFAKEVLKRSQGTTSSLLNRPPVKLPSGTGREPWKSMVDFLECKKRQNEVVAAQKALRTSAATVTLGDEETGVTEPQKKTRKIYDHAELASLDAVYVSSKGKPDEAILDTLAKSLHLDKGQVAIWFQNQRRREKAAQYKPGQFQFKDNNK